MGTAGSCVTASRVDAARGYAGRTTRSYRPIAVCPDTGREMEVILR